MKRFLKDNRGEAHLKTAIIIIVSIVIGGVLLGGLYFLFRGQNGVVNQMSDSIENMVSMDGSTQFRLLTKDNGEKVLQYSYDGSRWFNSLTPAYGEGAVPVAEIHNTSEEHLIRTAYVQEGNTFHIITSTDGGIRWEEKLTITGITEVTHFYYGTSSALPWGAGHFEGERFVFRYMKSTTPYTISSDGETWIMPEWSDMIPLG